MIHQTASWIGAAPAAAAAPRRAARAVVRAVVRTSRCRRVRCELLRWVMASAFRIGLGWVPRPGAADAMCSAGFPDLTALERRIRSCW